MVSKSMHTLHHCVEVGVGLTQGEDLRPGIVPTEWSGATI